LYFTYHTYTRACTPPPSQIHFFFDLFCFTFFVLFLIFYRMENEQVHYALNRTYNHRQLVKLNLALLKLRSLFISIYNQHYIFKSVYARLNTNIYI
jgi:hypothetical protein